MIGSAGLACVMVAAVVVPAATGWQVHALSFPPLQADWRLRLGPGTLPAVALALVAVRYAVPVASRWPWRWLLVAAFGFGLAWMVSLATVDGWAGIGHALGTEYEYLPTARGLASAEMSDLLGGFVDRIPAAASDSWPVHVAGHPPGALLFFVALVRLGLGSGLAAGSVVIVLAASTPVAVVVAVRRLAGSVLARRAAPFLVVGPAAIWQAVSADAVFAAAAAWGLCCLAIGATARTSGARVAWTVGAGLLLGGCLLLSYGLPLLGVLAAAVLVAARTWRPLPWAAGAAAAVVLAFAAAGFAWWEAYPVLVTRYWDGVAAVRPSGYWIWADVAALGFSAGPLLGVSVAAALRRIQAARPIRRTERAVLALTVAAVVAVVAADLSGMSKGEVERIWLPFVPWLLLGTALLTARWRTVGVAVQVGFALVVQHLLLTRW